VPDPVASAADAELRARVEQVLAANFELDREIGRGGMGIVYLARDRRLKRPVAIKLLPPELAYRSEIRSRFLREAETAAQLSHPHIVPIFTVDERDGLVFFVMGYVDGDTLAQRLSTDGALPIDDARRIASEVADALAYAHARNVIHRDIKPDNILLARDGSGAMVTDFGIARAVTGDGADTRLTATGVAIGTPAYMSPEQCAGDKEIDGRSDLYSLGVVAYQMVAGVPPFQGNATATMLLKHLSEQPVPLHERRSGVPVALDRTIMRLLEKNPADRFPTAGALLAALESGEVPEPSRSWIDSGGQLAGGARAGTSAARASGAPAAPESQVSPANPAPVSGLESWTARPVVRFRKRLATYAIVNTMIVVISIVTRDSDPLNITAFWSVMVAWWYAKLWTAGYDWHEVFRQPRDRMFFDVAAESMEGLRGLFNKKARAELRSRRRARELAAAEVPGPPRAVARRVTPVPPPSSRAAAVGADVDEAAKLAPPDVLNGPYGTAVRRAAADRGAVRDLFDRLGAADRGMLPDVVQTVDNLVKRTASLAGELHRLDHDLAPNALPALDRRIAAAETEPATTPDRERKLALLRRQRATLLDLGNRRASLSSQLESAGLVLQNIRFDLLKLRSSGVQSALEDVASATQEARALSREIGHVLNAADELRTV
jgi:serine/threonine protein kinase